MQVWGVGGEGTEEGGDLSLPGAVGVLVGGEGGGGAPLAAVAGGGGVVSSEASSVQRERGKWSPREAIAAAERGGEARAVEAMGGSHMLQISNPPAAAGGVGVTFISPALPPFPSEGGS